MSVVVDEKVCDSVDGGACEWMGGVRLVYRLPVLFKCCDDVLGVSDISVIYA